MVGSRAASQLELCDQPIKAPFSMGESPKTWLVSCRRPDWLYNSASVKVSVRANQCWFFSFLQSSRQDDHHCRQAFFYAGDGWKFILVEDKTLCYFSLAIPSIFTQCILGKLTNLSIRMCGICGILSSKQDLGRQLAITLSKEKINAEFTRPQNVVGLDQITRTRFLNNLHQVHEN